MKRNGDTASLFQKQAAKKKAAAATATSNPDPVEPVVKEQTHKRVVEKIVNPMPPPLPPPQPSSLPPVYNINRLPHDLGERRHILNYPVNDQDAIRRAYIIKGPFKPFAHDFSKRKISDRDRGFNYYWMYNNDWLEYSIKKDDVFCFICYLFKKGIGSDTFTVDGWKNWNIGKKALRKHMGSKAHIAAQERYIGFTNPKVAIDYNIEK
ncbi:uncharacterized protein [Miscanthus floridulus]|uniref:uncharacterized protein n=1 Tax=Miscanthus floridulus TaxID=154761 RepID=UPI003458C027